MNVTPQALRPTPDKIPVGVRRDGSIISVGIREQSGLIVGNPGAGKSGAQRVVLAGICQLENVAIIGIDPKRVELGLFADRMTLSLKDKPLFPILFDALYNEMDRRNQVLDDRGISKITPDMWWEFPQIVLDIDELPQVFVDSDNPGKRGEKSYNYIKAQELVALGRNTGITVISAAQRPKNDIIPTNFRDLQAWRMGFRMTALSAGLVFESPVPDTHLLRPRIDNGRGYLLGEESDPANPDFFRTFWLMSNDERAKTLANPDISADARNVAENAPTVEEIVEATKHLRVNLPFLDENKELQQGLAHIAQQRELARRAGEAVQEQAAMEAAADPEAANDGSYQP